MEKITSTVRFPSSPSSEIAMNKPTFFVGIDIASASFTASIGQVIGEKWMIIARPNEFTNTYDGFPSFLHWLGEHGANQQNAILCMEATGVYAEALAHFLVANRYPVSIEPPLQVRRAFKPARSKSDPVDSTQIAEYAYRFYDQLSLWAPRAEIVEQIKVLLVTREEFVSDMTGHKNALTALSRKVIRTPLAEALHEQAIIQLKTHIHTLEEEIERLIRKDPDMGATASLLRSIPGVGMLLSAFMTVIFASSPRALMFRSLSAYIGICPYEDSSGSSRHKPSTSRHYGPPGARKLLFLAALSLSTHHPVFHAYYQRKVSLGKSKRLVINNIANKLLKIMCAVVRSQTPFIPSYRSIHPTLLTIP